MSLQKQFTLKFLEIRLEVIDIDLVKILIQINLKWAKIWARTAWKSPFSGYFSLRYFEVFSHKIRKFFEVQFEVLRTA